MVYEVDIGVRLEIFRRRVLLLLRVQGGFYSAVNWDLRGRVWTLCMQYTDLSGACNMDHLWTVKEALIYFSRCW
jgi:hypothetical protein